MEWSLFLPFSQLCIASNSLLKAEAAGLGSSVALDTVPMFFFFFFRQTQNVSHSGVSAIWTDRPVQIQFFTACEHLPGGFISEF